MTAAAIGSLRCSAWARTVELDPGGTAGSYSGFLLIDEQLPWPRDAGEIEDIAGVADLLQGSGVRVQATVPAIAGRRTVSLYRNEAPGPFRGYEGRTIEFDEAEGAAGLRWAVSRLLAGEGAPMGARRTVLVCTHGRRDVCCGALGTELHGLLSSTSLPVEVEVLRTSHTGGHRFAPTFIVLPEGTMWAFADLQLAVRVLSRRGDPAAAADHYRGCAGLLGPRLQVLEREVLRRAGWELFSCARSGFDGAGGPGSSGSAGDGSDGNGRVRLEVETPDGDVQRWEARVVPGRQLPVPDCGRPLEEARKSETEWSVEDLRRI